MPPNLLLHRSAVKLGGQLVDLLRGLRVRHQSFFLRDEIVVSFGLRESGLPVLANHDKGGKEYGDVPLSGVLSLCRSRSVVEA